MGLEKKQAGATFVNLKEGEFYIKPKGSQEKEFFGSLSGIITKFEFKTDEYEGKEFELCCITVVDKEERFILQMRVDSSYFRHFCNALKTGDVKKKVVLIPSMKEVDGKKKRSFFVNQNGKPLKHAFTKENPGELPVLETAVFKGETLYDSTKQIQYWKDWLNSLELTDDFLAEDVVDDQPENTTAGGQAAEFYGKNKHSAPEDLTEPLDDLPF